MASSVNASLCKQAALKQLPRNKVPNMAVMIKSLTRSTVDASVVFKDPTGKESWKCLKFGSQDEEKSSAPFSDGIIEAISWPGLKPVAVTLDPETDHYVVFAGEMQGTVHRVLLETRQNELKPGSVLLLKQVGELQVGACPGLTVCLYLARCISSQCPSKEWPDHY
jgi:hypothetical protein